MRQGRDLSWVLVVGLAVYVVGVLPLGLPAWVSGVIALGIALALAITLTLAEHRQRPQREADEHRRAVAAADEALQLAEARERQRRKERSDRELAPLRRAIAESNRIMRNLPSPIEKPEEKPPADQEQGDQPPRFRDFDK